MRAAVAAPSCPGPIDHPGAAAAYARSRRSSLGSTRADPKAVYEEADRALVERVIAWLGWDPDHWPNFHLVLLDPRQDEPGRWREGLPRWVRVLAADAVLAHVQQDPPGRRRGLDLSSDMIAGPGADRNEERDQLQRDEDDRVE